MLLFALVDIVVVVVVGTGTLLANIAVEASVAEWSPNYLGLSKSGLPLLVHNGEGKVDQR